MYTHANKTKNQGWIYRRGGAPPLAQARGGAIFYDKAKNTK